MDQAVYKSALANTSEECISSICRDGYARIPQAFGQDTVKEALDRIRYWFEKTIGEQSDRMPRLNRAQPMVYNLQSKDMFFNRLILETPIIEDTLKHFLNDQWFSVVPPEDPNYILRSFLARSSNYRMPMHIDSFVPYTGSFPFIMQCSILLEDQTLENGCTLIVPGSHQADQYADPESYKTAVPIEARAGDLVFWDSRIWHGAGENTSGGTRWSIIATFCRWWIKQAFDIPGNVPQEIYDQFTNRQRAVMGYCSVPYDDETYGIDMKRGYELLPEKVSDYKYSHSA